MEICNVGLRAGTLAAKFGLLIVLAFYLSPDEVGNYGLFAAVLAWLIYLAGADFYTFSAREMIGSSQLSVYNFVINQIRFHFITYIPILFLVILLQNFGILSKNYFLPFILLLVFEHLGLEVGRILIALQRPIFASTVLFIRGGAWCLVVAGLFAFVPSARTLDTVLHLWIAGSVTALCLGFVVLMAMIGRDEKVSFDLGWIWGGVKIALPLMMGSLAVRGILTADRIWVEQIAGAEVLGAYVFYIGIATVIVSFIDAAVVDFSYPKLVLLVKQGAREGYEQELRRLAFKVVAITFVLSAASSIFIFQAAKYFENPIYAQYMYLVPYIIGAIAVYGISTIPHVALYAHRRDRVIIVSQISGFLFFIAAWYFVPINLGIDYIVYALVGSFLLILAIKSFYAINIKI